MKKEIDIEKVLLVNQYTFEVIDGVVYTEILDIELDPIKCVLQEYYIELNTENLAYVQLDIDKLKTMIDLIKQAKSYYNIIDIMEEDENDELYNQNK
jgi:hypothetical protein